MALNNAGNTMCFYKGGSAPVSCLFLELQEKKDLRNYLLDNGVEGNVTGAFISPLDNDLTISQINEDLLEDYARSVISDIQYGVITTIDSSISGSSDTLHLDKSVFDSFANRPADMHEYIDSGFAEYRWNTTYKGDSIQLRVQVQKFNPSSEMTFVVMINFSPIFGSLFALSELCVKTTKVVKVRSDTFPNFGLYDIGATLPSPFPLTVAKKNGKALTLTTIANYPQLT